MIITGAERVFAIPRTEAEIFDVIDRGNVAVGYFADWCMPCRIVVWGLRDYSGLKSILSDKRLGLMYVDTDIHREVVRQERVDVIPSVIVYGEGGREIKRFIGCGSSFTEWLRQQPVR